MYVEAEPSEGVRAAAMRTLVSRSIETTRTHILDTLNPTRADDAEDAKRPVASRSSQERQPAHLRPHNRKMPFAVIPGLRLDHDSDSGRRDRNRVDVPDRPRAANAVTTTPLP
jgi:hypothetical protein